LPQGETVPFAVNESIPDRHSFVPARHNIGWSQDCNNGWHAHPADGGRAWFCNR